MHLYDDNARFGGVCLSRQAELYPQVNHWDDPATQVHHPSTKAGTRGTLRDLHNADDLLHLQDRQAIYLLLEPELRYFPARIRGSADTATADSSALTSDPMVLASQLTELRNTLTLPGRLRLVVDPSPPQAHRCGYAKDFG